MKLSGCIFGAPMVVLALLCLGLGIFAGPFLQGWLLPGVGALGVDTSAVHVTAGGTLETPAGWWSPTLGTGLILIGVILGLLLYVATRAMRVRITPTFIGGEVAGESSRFAGPDFYETVRKLPLLNRLYGDAEAGAFDGYRLSGQAGQVVVNLLRSWHSGLLPVYVAWVLFGLLATLLWLLLG